MEALGSTTLENDDQGKALEGLLDAFCSRFSLEEIASAYCKAGQNVDLAGAILYDLQESTSTSSTLVSNSETKSEKSSESSYGNISEESCQTYVNFKASKTRIHPASMGTISSVLGKGYARSMSLANGPCLTAKSLKLDPKDLLISELSEKDYSINSAKDEGTLMDIEDFLVKMLGDGFKLDRDMIREVLGSCGYDMEKSMEKLLDLSATTLGERANFICESTKKSSEKCLKEESRSNAASKGNRVLETSGIELLTEQKVRNDIQKELLTSLFHVPERQEFSGRTVAVHAVNRSKPFGQLVVEPPRDTTAEHKTGTMNAHHKNEDDEDDSYNVLRRAVKEYRGTMKEYYKAAVEAFSEEDRVRAGKLLEKGHFFHQKATEADEESVQKIFETRSEETQEAMSLDLQNLHANEAIRLLKCHLSSLSGIPSIKHLKVIVERNDLDISKGARKRLIIRLLEKESIKWIEEGNAGTLLIYLDEINPKNLRFARK